MASSNPNERSGEPESLQPPPAIIPPNVLPSRAEPEKSYDTKRLPMARRGVGSKGQRIRLLTNHFRVDVGNKDGYFYHYSVFPALFICLIAIVTQISVLTL